jgi:hypothetical protein
MEGVMVGTAAPRIPVVLDRIERIAGRYVVGVGRKPG